MKSTLNRNRLVDFPGNTSCANVLVSIKGTAAVGSVWMHGKESTFQKNIYF